MTNSDPNRIDRIEATLATHNEILNQLAPLTAQISQLLAQQTARGDHHDQALRQLENSMQALSQTQAETLRLIADNSREIQRIWQHLERRFDNGNGNRSD